jgi:hypothetical protein
MADSESIVDKPSPLMGEGGSRSEPGEGISDQKSPHPAFGHLLPKGEGHDLPQESEPDWLVYHHQRRLAAVAENEETVEDAPITDANPYNQTQPKIAPEPVHDLLLACEVRWQRGTEITFHMSFESQDWVFTRPSKIDDSRYSADNWHHVAFSIIENIGLCSVDGKINDLVNLNDYSPPDAPTKTPFAISARGGRVEIRHLQVWRDLYYDVPPELAPTERSDESVGLHEPAKLGSDEYYVLGDNSSRSFDSRYRRFGTVDASLLAGRPLAVVWSPRDVNLLGWHFQVPTFSRIRYIPSYEPN